MQQFVASVYERVHNAINGLLQLLLFLTPTEGNHSHDPQTPATLGPGPLAGGLHRPGGQATVQAVPAPQG
jgi:hypothetical protein